MTVAIGRFGPYIKHDSKFYSLTKTDEPFSLTKDRAVEIILAKRKADAEKVLKVFEENSMIQILNGRWGPYIAFNSIAYKIPKGKDPKALTLEECLSIIEANPDKKPSRFAKKKAAAATKTTKTAATKKTTKAKTTKATSKAKEEATEEKKVTKKATTKKTVAKTTTKTAVKKETKAKSTTTSKTKAKK
jgi:DNA topoisomerase-1